MPTRTIRQHMTLSPEVIEADRTLADAHRAMRARGIRHLPVVEGGVLVGVVSQRDLYLLETLAGVDPATERVSEAMTPEPYAVPPDAPLEAVATAMADHKYGCAVVVESGAVVGLFTTVDALRTLAAVLRRRHPAAAIRRAGNPVPGPGTAPP